MKINQLEAIAKQAYENSLLIQAELAAQKDRAAELGDIFIFKNPTDVCFSMAAISQHPDDKDLFLCVPVDNCPLSGLCDVEDGEPNRFIGKIIARCGYSLWIERKHLKDRVGILHERHLKNCRSKMATVARGTMDGTEAQYENEANPDYHEHQEDIGRYTENLRLLLERH